MTEAKKLPKGGVAVALACLIAAPMVAHFEGKRNAAYADPIGLPTICYGHMDQKLKLGTWYSDDACAALLDSDLRHHAEGAARCTPGITRKPEIFAAATSLAFNIGVSRYCTSTAAKRFNSGDFRGGCEALGMFVYAGGRKLPGLIRRRKAEVELCMKGVK